MNTILCSDIKSIPYGLMSHQVTKILNRNIEKIKCWLSQEGLCEEQLIGLAVGQFCPLGEDNSVKLDFSIHDLPFNVGETTYSIDTNTLPLGVSAVVLPDGNGEITIDPDVYDIDAEPFLEVEHTITAENGIISKAKNIIALSSVGGHPNGEDTQTSPHCCFQGVCTPNIFGLPGGAQCPTGAQFRTRDECNEFVWCCEPELRRCTIRTRCGCLGLEGTPFDFEDRQQCLEECEKVVCCQPTGENGLSECVVVPIDECEGDFWPNTAQGEFDCNCECLDCICCAEDIDCELMNGLKCSSDYNGACYSDPELCEELCKDVWCCDENEEGIRECVEVFSSECGGIFTFSQGECEALCEQDCCLESQVTESPYLGEVQGDTNMDAVGPPADEGGSTLNATMSVPELIQFPISDDFEVSWNIDLGSWIDWGDYEVNITVFIPPNHSIFEISLGQQLSGSEIIDFDAVCNSDYSISLSISTSTAGPDKTGDLNMSVASRIIYGANLDDSDCINQDIEF